mmetsp:Transcript_15806/g.45057  ORF Transcript_15806/g.45057 Transcript_15806/m.45057 type:complete len:205 (+) Transcript_15806:371-985(+)
MGWAAMGTKGIEPHPRAPSRLRLRRRNTRLSVDRSTHEVEEDHQHFGRLPGGIRKTALLDATPGAVRATRFRRRRGRSNSRRCRWRRRRSTSLLPPAPTPLGLRVLRTADQGAASQPRYAPSRGPSRMRGWRMGSRRWGYARSASPGSSVCSHPRLWAEARSLDYTVPRRRGRSGTPIRGGSRRRSRSPGRCAPLLRRGATSVP